MQETALPKFVKEKVLDILQMPHLEVQYATDTRRTP